MTRRCAPPPHLASPEGEESAARFSAIEMFHVKHRPFLSLWERLGEGLTFRLNGLGRHAAARPLTQPSPRGRGRSFADAEAGEDAVEDVFGVDTASDAVEGAAGEADILGGEFEVAFQH